MDVGGGSYDSSWFLASVAAAAASSRAWRGDLRSASTSWTASASICVQRDRSSDYRGATAQRTKDSGHEPLGWISPNKESPTWEAW